MRCILMHRKIPTAAIELDDKTGRITSLLDVYAQDHLPLGVYHDGRIDHKVLAVWWRGRSIPASRDGLTSALEKLGVSDTSLLLEKSYGLSLSDQYWICPDGMDLIWEKINFFDNPFSEDVGNILFGGELQSDDISFMTPDNTSDGWLKKKWKIIDGDRYLLKGGSGTSQQEPYNEVIASAIMRRLNIPHVEYRILMQGEYPFSVCRDFVSRDTELVSAHYVTSVCKKAGHQSAYAHFVTCCETLGLKNTEQFLNQMLTLDYLIANEDRHYGNFGVIRDAVSLQFTGFAPLFDSGTSFWYATPTRLIKPLSPQLPAKPFKTTQYEQIKLVTSFDWLDFKALRGIEDECREILEGAPFLEEHRINVLCQALAERVAQLEALALERQKEACCTEPLSVKKRIDQIKSIQEEKTAVPLNRQEPER